MGHSNVQKMEIYNLSLHEMPMRFADEHMAEQKFLWVEAGFLTEIHGTRTYIYLDLQLKNNHSCR